MAEVDDRAFEPDEWAACLKVLEALGRQPEAVPEHDRERLERLVARLYRKTRRGRRKDSAQARRADDRALVERTGRVRSTTGSSPPLPDQIDNLPAAALLKAKSRSCYICKARYREVHLHYHLLCPLCAHLNEQKRHQRADLSGRRAIVTGGRIKIGYHTALKLLRDGAQVLVTTRFPREAACRYASEPDFDTWRDRLRIERLDFRMLPEVLAFTDRLCAELPALEILINNAAQTVRPSPEALAEAQALERLAFEALPANIRPLLGVDPLRERPAADGEALDATVGRMPVLFDGRDALKDRRESNSWTARLDDVPPLELLEVLLINAAAPYLLIGRLKTLFLRSPFADRYVINVAGLDGQFGRAFKTDRHPHVNMSKAALNMITRTSAADYARDGIFMNSVDAGWITHEGAYSTRTRMRAQGFVPPLDEIDGASRIYDPIVRGLNGVREFGRFFKDYQPTGW